MNWEIFAGVAVFIAMLIMGGYIKRIKKEVGEARAALTFLIDTFKEAIKDKELTDEERKNILDAFEKAKRECKDVADLAYEVAGAFVLAKKKMQS